MKVLILEDNISIATLIRLTLARLGLQDIVHTANGEEALSALAEHRFDLALLDWNVPKITGLDVAQHIRADPKHQYIPIIMVTARHQQEEVVEALDKGVTDYIAKPFERETLIEKIRKVTGLST